MVFRIFPLTCVLISDYTLLHMPVTVFRISPDPFALIVLQTCLYFIGIVKNHKAPTENVRAVVDTAGYPIDFNYLPLNAYDVARYYIHSFCPQTTCCDVSSCNKATSGTLWGTVFISFYGVGYKPQEGNENKLLTFGVALLWTFLLGDTDRQDCYWWHWTEQGGNCCVLKNEDQPWIFGFF